MDLPHLCMKLGPFSANFEAVANWSVVDCCAEPFYLRVKNESVSTQFTQTRCNEKLSMTTTCALRTK